MQHAEQKKLRQYRSSCGTSGSRALLWNGLFLKLCLTSATIRQSLTSIVFQGRALERVTTRLEATNPVIIRLGVTS